MGLYQKKQNPWICPRCQKTYLGDEGRLAHLAWHDATDKKAKDITERPTAPTGDKTYKESATLGNAPKTPVEPRRTCPQCSWFTHAKDGEARIAEHRAAAHPDAGDDQPPKGTSDNMSQPHRNILFRQWRERNG